MWYKLRESVYVEVAKKGVPEEMVSQKLVDGVSASMRYYRS